MTELIKKYNSIMNRYKNGEFGELHLTIYEIMEKGGEPDLINRMEIQELLYLAENSSYMLKYMFYKLAEQKKH